jgi:two-component system, LuxR family, response regulator FixJ
MPAAVCQILGALMQGKPNNEIAGKFGISPSTVEVHRARLTEKMNFRSPSALMRTAIVAGCKV